MNQFKGPVSPPDTEGGESRIIALAILYNYSVEFVGNIVKTLGWSGSIAFLSNADAQGIREETMSMGIGYAARSRNNDKPKDIRPNENV